VLVFTEAAQDISFEEMVRHQQAAAAIVAQQPYVDAMMSSMGSSGSVNSTPNQGRIFMRLKPRRRTGVDRPDHGRAAAETLGDPRTAGLSADSAGDPASAASSPRRFTSSRSRAATSPSSTRFRASMEKKFRALAPSWWM